jgi:hypothetical protein
MMISLFIIAAIILYMFVANYLGQDLTDHCKDLLMRKKYYCKIRCIKKNFYIQNIINAVRKTKQDTLKFIDKFYYFLKLLMIIHLLLYFRYNIDMASLRVQKLILFVI